MAPAGIDRHADGQTTPAWQPAGLAEGYSGIALLHAELGDRQAAYAHLAAANRADPLSDGGHMLLAGRLPGLLLAARAAARGPGDYTGLIGMASPPVAAAVRRTAAAELDRAARGTSGTRFTAYDVISGLTGATRLLLACGTEPEALDAALRALVALTGGIHLVGGGPELPGWYVEHGWDGPDRGTSHLNVGLAHGISGPLAALSIAYRDGVRVPGQAEAIERIVTWLLAQRRDLAGAPTWPEIVVPGGRSPVPSGRPGWCHGEPGLARAVQLAGMALDVPTWRTTAVQALRAALGRPWEGFGMVDAGLCHGWSGLLQITLRIAWDEGDERVAEAADQLAARVVHQFTPDAPFGFGHTAPPGLQMSPNQPGFLCGAAGIALALHTYATDSPPLNGWDAALLLS